MSGYGDIRDVLVELPHHHGGNGYMTTDLFTVRHEIIRRLDPVSVFEFGALLGYFLVTALDAAPSITRVGWVDIEAHTEDSNRLCEENLRDYCVRHGRRVDTEVWWGNPRASTAIPPGPYDLIQVDGDHSFGGCYLDLLQASLLWPKWIMLDDWLAAGHMDEIQKATRRWLREREEAGESWHVDVYQTVNGLAVLTRAMSERQGGDDGEG